MEHDPLAWLSDELGLPAAAESAGRVLVNAPALAAGCVDRPESLEAALCGLIGRGELSAELREALAAARSGAAVSKRVVVGGVGAQELRLLFLPHGFGQVRAVVAPESLASAAELSRRASLVDVAAAVSHEVANAVGAIAGWAELATQPGSDVSPQEALQLIASCARTAQEAARGLLGLARGEQVEEPDEFDLSELARELLSLLALPAREARVRLIPELAPELTVLGSRSQLFSVLWNLTKNAIEACGAGGQVKVQLAGIAGRVTLDVRDTGPGLAPEQLSRIFTPYYSTKERGTGLGLSLVQQAVADLGGDITVQSTKGRGTLFRVSLPRATRPSKVVPALPSHAANTAGLSARILVVDDDKALREMVATALSLRGADVVVASCSEEARRAEGSFDIALIDMMLDEYRGDELLASLRRHGSVSAAMLVTGTVQKPRLVPGGEPDDWLRKPFELSHLEERVRRVLDRHRMLNSVTATAVR